MASHGRKRNYRDTRRPLRPDMEPGQQNAVCRDRPPSSVVELDTEGNVLRVIPSDGDHDFEAIEYLGGNRYALSRERERTLTTHCIDSSTTVLPPATYSLTLDVNRHSDNAGFEGLARGRGEHALMVAQEKNRCGFT